MAIIAGVALALMAQGPVEVVADPHSDFDVGYEELVANDNAAARAAIEKCDELAADDPARLINHGIALARTGNGTYVKDWKWRKRRGKRPELPRVINKQYSHK